MSSSLTWIDHDPAARERSLRILALFQEKESRDELGLGGIRDSFADLLFTGTSTIQTRLRYMLFVPWIYRALENKKVPPGEFAQRADNEERDLIVAMRNADEREDGVFGGRSGRHLKRLPSAVYWGGRNARATFDRGCLRPRATGTGAATVIGSHQDAHANLPMSGEHQG